MRSTRLTILAVTSLVALAILLCGYFIDGDVGLIHITWTRQALTYRFCAVSSWRGAMSVDWGKYVLPNPRPAPAGFHIGKSRWNIGLPRARPSLWEFHIDNRKTAAVDTITLGCPNWLLILPCTIAPFLWWRRPRTAAMRGFDVEPREIAGSLSTRGS